MKGKAKLITWDIALLAGILIYINMSMPESYGPIVGISTGLVLINYIKNHIAAFKFSGKIY